METSETTKQPPVTQKESRLRRWWERVKLNAQQSPPPRSTLENSGAFPQGFFRGEKQENSGDSP